jgi:hypothetical protein
MTETLVGTRPNSPESRGHPFPHTEVPDMDNSEAVRLRIREGVQHGWKRPLASAHRLWMDKTQSMANTQSRQSPLVFGGSPRTRVHPVPHRSTSVPGRKPYTAPILIGGPRQRRTRRRKARQADPASLCTTRGIGQVQFSVTLSRTRQERRTIGPKPHEPSRVIQEQGSYPFERE